MTINKLWRHDHFWSGLVLLLLTATLIFFLWQLAHSITPDSRAESFVQHYGYLAIFLISFFSGLNFIIPLPTMAFTPIFLAGGIPPLKIIIFLSAGTILANLIAYYLGRFGKKYADNRYPIWQKRINDFVTKYTNFLPWVLLITASFIPVSEKFYLIPLGLTKVSAWKILPPVIIGNIVYHTLTTITISLIFLYYS